MSGKIKASHRYKPVWRFLLGDYRFIHGKFQFKLTCAGVYADLGREPQALLVCESPMQRQAITQRMT